MRMPAMLSIRGSQSYLGQDPEVVELMTEGFLEQTEDGWKLGYEESDLTGLEGVTTTFLIVPGKITLSREGRLNSKMEFEQGVYHDSLYQMEFGALMITVCAKKVAYDITQHGGTVDLAYGIEIEQSAAGAIEYHLDIRVK